MEALESVEVQGEVGLDARTFFAEEYSCQASNAVLPGIPQTPT